jgi:benzoate/toluate 1,2-dioxygenase beta subunit
VSATGDSSRASHYVSDTLYRDLIAQFSDWRRDDRLVSDPAERDRFRGLIEREARLLDEQRFEEWLALFADECIYWAPATPHGGDPRREVAVIFDDRRNMEGRVFRLKSGYAWSQVPASRTAHLVGNVEVFAAEDDAHRMVRSTFLVHEFRDGEMRLLSGWCGHRFGFRHGRWEILVKQVNLLNCDQPIRNLSVVL